MSFTYARLPHSLKTLFPKVIASLLLAGISVAGSSWMGGLAHAQTSATPNTWTWPAIPGCLADPEIQTQGTTDYNSPICSVYDRLLASGEIDLELRSARRVNAEMDGVLYPAFVPGTEVVTFITTDKFIGSFTGTSGLVRVSGRSISARSGSWWTTLDNVSQGGQLLDAEAIQRKLALPSSPACIAYADSVRPGVRAYMGVVAPAFGQNGGGAEFWFPPSAVIATKTAQIPGGTACDSN
ncbi:hypothetical protein AciX8_2468 [Granulicella mallensis MP5ACTX8]|uniref:Uncharacterized protein n=2 Tax=Granulicella mallensis TaxID=940614 RepID=G8NZ48_GRAMM|nr:hypothetical protein AciX8_2468 [Granulicella mallensis MP5ACTX8]